MSALTGNPADILAELRRSFDESFARLPAPATSEEGLLALRLGPDAFAVRVAELRGLEILHHLVPLPGAPALLLGLTGLRGRLVPVYDLAALLGYGASDGPRWLLLCGGDEPVGLAIVSFEGLLQVPRTEVFAGRSGQAAHVRELVRVGSAVRNVLDLASLVRDIQARANANQRREER